MSITCTVAAATTVAAANTAADTGAAANTAAAAAGTIAAAGTVTAASTAAAVGTVLGSGWRGGGWRSGGWQGGDGDDGGDGEAAAAGTVAAAGMGRRRGGGTCNACAYVGDVCVRMRECGVGSNRGDSPAPPGPATRDISSSPWRGAPHVTGSVGLIARSQSYAISSGSGGCT